MVTHPFIDTLMVPYSIMIRNQKNINWFQLIKKKFLSNPNRDGKVYGRHQASYWAPLSDLSNLPYCIAITGGIACGKSTAAKFLSTHGKVPFVDCDKLGS